MRESDDRLRNMTSVYLVRDGELLMLYRIGSRIVSNLYVGSAGGHFEKDELNDPRACVLRELREELGLEETDIEGLKLRYITLRLIDGEIRQNYYFFAGLKADRALHSTEGILEWVPYDAVGGLPMPVSAKQMILHYLETGRHDEILYAGITGIHGTSFVPMADFEG